MAVAAGIGVYLSAAGDNPSGEEQSPGESRPVAPAYAGWKRQLERLFAGDRACRGCHAEQFAAHQRSGHSRTARRMADSDLAARLNKTTFRDPLRDYSFRFRLESGQFSVSIPEKSELAPLRVDWLLGSGTHAQTPVAVLESENEGIEQRFTWFAATNALGLTPEHDVLERYRDNTTDCFGRPLDAKGVRGCLSCHMTFGPLQSQPLARELFQPNISCERCHGPRKTHVKEARAGRPERSKPVVSFKTAAAYLKVCGQCHRDQSNVDEALSKAQLARFQPYGLQKSRCYQKTPGGINCSQCHNPHDRVSHDDLTYNRQCLSCHSASGQRLCPKSPKAKCIGCHMPAVKFVERVSFHDHDIRKRRRGE
jgi:Cytochrome c554 and c-prime